MWRDIDVTVFWYTCNWKVVGSCAHTHESRGGATVHVQLPYTVNSHVVVGAIYAGTCVPTAIVHGN